MRKFSALTIVFSLLTFGITQPSFADAPPFTSIDPALPAVYSLTQCTTAAELDCIDSVRTKNASGEFIDAAPMAGATWQTRTDDMGNSIYEINTDWQSQSNLFNGVFSVTVTLETPAHVIFRDNQNTFIGGALRIQTWGVPTTLEVKVSVRTSWLKPQNVQLVADNSNFGHQTITGGNLWEFTGSPTQVSYYDDWAAAYADGFRGRADSSSPEMHFFIHHAGVDDMHSYFPPTCSDFGYTVQAFNSNSAGSPEWNNETHSLDFNIFAPHLDANGELNQGFFKLWTTDAFINCRWPENTLTTGGGLIAKILNEDGSEQEATVTTSHADGKVYLATSGFHYSSPTIRLISAPRAPARVFNPSINGKVETNGDSRTIFGNNLGYVTSIKAGNTSLEISKRDEGSLTFSTKDLPAGTYDLELSGSEGAMKWLEGLVIKPVARVEPLVTVSTAVTPAFKFGEVGLSVKQKALIRSAISGATSFTCRGTITASDVRYAEKKLAKARAVSACNYAQSLNPKLSTHAFGGFLVSPESMGLLVQLKSSRTLGTKTKN